MPSLFPPTPPGVQRTVRRIAGFAALALVLGGVLGVVFQAYRSPDFLLTLADQVWGCF